MNVCAFEVSVKGTNWSQIINSSSSGKAKSEYHRQVTDAWPEVPFTSMRCRKIGPAHTSDQFIRNAVYRGMPGLRCGLEVSVGGELGVIVGHNSSANFDVLFSETSKYKGSVLNVHPQSIEVVL